MIRFRKMVGLALLGVLSIGAGGCGASKETAEPATVQTQTISVDPEVKTALATLITSVQDLQGRVNELEGQVGPYASSIDPLSDQIDELDARLLDAEDCISRILQWSNTMNTRFWC